jgi:hypothetical protein
MGGSFLLQARGPGPVADASVVRIEDVLRRHAGVVTLVQAVACGWSPDAVQRRVRSGSWTRLHPGVHLAGGHRLGDEARVRAAWPWAGEPSLVSGSAAAWWHGMLRRAPDLIEVTVPRGMKPRPRIRRRDLPTAATSAGTARRRRAGC